MGSGNNKLAGHAPAVLKLAGVLLSKDEINSDILKSSLNSFEQGFSADRAPLAHEFSPYLYYLLTQQERTGTASENLLGLLRDSALQAASVAIARRYIIKQIGEMLNTAGVDAILLKGAAMDRWTYPEQGFRLGGDIDLLVREGDYARIDSALEPLAKHQAKYPEQKAFNAFAVEKPFFVASPTQVYLDVHRNLTIPHVYSLDPGELFERASPHPAEPSLLVMSPEDNLLHFAVHSFYDMRLFSKQTLDAYQLIGCSEIDWGDLADSAKLYKMEEPLEYFLCGLRAAFDMNGKGMPDEMGCPTTEKKWVIANLLLASPAVLAKRGLSFRARQLSCQLLLSGNVRGYIRYNLAYAQARLKA